VSFEKNLIRLEEIVAELESDDLQLDSALRLFEEGIERLREASADLARAESRVALLVEQSDGAFELRDRRG
jgi:exodeoxyribonuclease VII small subunit